MEEKPSKELFQRPLVASSGSAGRLADSQALHLASPETHPRSDWGPALAAPPTSLHSLLSLGPGLTPHQCPQPAGSSLPPSAPLVCDPQASGESLVHHGSEESHQQSDIRKLWTTATLSQMNLNLPLSKVEEWSDTDGSSFCHQKSGVDLDAADWEWDDRKRDSLPGDNNFKQELDEHTLSKLELHRGRSLGSNLEERESRTEAEKSSSMSSLSILKQTPHRAYWAEQQNRLPLPLTELMENEAVEILTKALQSYRSGIGKDHFLTKQLQRSIEGLKKRRNKRLHVSLR
ncbi:cation channel sperm-associated auxiliary subunit zeta [Elephas maximus indicus]|uniref:cation channel sperm-associated auxiliary subunit zeta n=1 Tax=Elephas maximus indicus TaxID=99487 RepID=UPI002116E6F4|nr:cation channel sperm-associated auxiliary subunit zeta [Elephas maximus indicus]